MEFPENIGFKELTKETFPSWTQRTKKDKWWAFYEYRLFYDYMYQKYMLYTEDDLEWGNWVKLFTVEDYSTDKVKKEIYDNYILKHTSNIRRNQLSDLLD